MANQVPHNAIGVAIVGLDAAGKEATLELLDSANATGAAVIVATHELLFVERVQRCLALRDGELIHDGSVDPAELLRLVSV